MTEAVMESPQDVHIEYIRGDIHRLDSAVTGLSKELRDHMDEEAEKDAELDKKLDRIIHLGYVIAGLLALVSGSDAVTLIKGALLHYG